MTDQTPSLPAEAFTHRVIEQVLATLKQQFEREGLEIHVLEELKGRWIKHLNESRAAAVAATALARDVGDGQRFVPHQYVPTGVVAQGSRLEGVAVGSGPLDSRPVPRTVSEPQTILEGLDSYFGGGYQAAPGGQVPQ